MAFTPLSSHGAGKQQREVDFNFPQDVSKEALADLDKALKKGDGYTVVDALVRYSLAQSSISPDNLPEIINRIEHTANKEKDPAVKALLFLLEARIFNDYSESYGVWDRRRIADLDDDPDEEVGSGSGLTSSGNGEDYSEWAPEQFKNRIDSLLRLSIANPAALKAVPLRSLEGIVRSESPVGYDLLPTLLSFVCCQASTLVTDDNLEITIDRAWVEGTKGDPASHIYALMKADDDAGGKGYSDIYNEWRDNQWSGLALRMLYAGDHYADLKDYVARFPDSPFTPEFRNKIVNIEERNMALSYREHITSRDDFKVNVRMSNINSGTVRLYQVPDTMLERLSKQNWPRLVIKTLPLVAERQATVQGQMPFSAEAEVNFGSLPFGSYVAIPAYKVNGEEMSLAEEPLASIVRVHDINTFNIATVSDGGLIIVVDCKSGAPVSGALVKSTSSLVRLTDVTGDKGEVAVPKNLTSSFDYTAVKGNDRYLPGQHYYITTSDYRTSMTVKLYTDLGIYRPGETVQLAGVVYNGDGMNNAVLPGTKLSIQLDDAANNKVESQEATADEFGRFTASFDLPTDRMNGSWTFRVRALAPHEAYYGNTSYKEIEVSEYKTPTFEIEWIDVKQSYVNHQPVKLAGRIMTYSGMPLQDTEVQLLVNQEEWSWWWRYSSRDTGDEVFNDTVRTDSNGRFEIVIPAEEFEENESGRRYWWSLYRYTAHAMATDKAGETHEAHHGFIIGTRRGLQFTKNEIEYRNTAPIKLPLVYNTTSETQTWVPCTWELLKGDESVATGNLNTNDPTIDLTKVPSGKYRIKVHILDAGDDEDDATVTADIILYRLDDKQAPEADTPLWVPEAERSVDDKNVGRFLVGVSGSEAHVYMVTSTRTKVLDNRWLHLKPGMHTITVNVPREAEECVHVKLIAMRDNKVYNEDFTLEAPANIDGLKVAVKSFRNKLVPGEKEHWTFTVKGRHGDNRHAAMMLEMFDKALNTLADNSWSAPQGRLYRYDPVRTSTFSYLSFNSTNRRWSDKTFNAVDIDEPYFYLYDESFFGTMGYKYFNFAAGASRRLYKMQATADMASPMMVEDEKISMEDGAAELDEVVTAFGVSTEAKEQLDNVQMRMADVKTALWKPMLTTNEQGEAQVEFDAPQFNTTWIVQAVAWDNRVYGDRINFEVLTQKPIMVKANPPRFLRQGDTVTLAASVQNATDAPAAYNAVIELFDPRTEAVLATRNVQGNLEAMATDAITIDWQVPADAAFVGVRVKAVAGGFGDGEQVMVPVLENSQPVIESTPFYIEAGTAHASIDLPQFPEGARVTLEYCDNPVWYCVTALPTIFDGDYVSASSLAHNLFALRVAQGVATLKPEVKQAIDYWKANDEDSTLMSMLATNRDLKIGTLLASPWLPEADRQTLRMSRLNELFDTEKMAAEQTRIVDRLLSLQNADGGLSWVDYPYRESSLWATGLVLEIIGQLRQMECLNKDERLEGLVQRAIAFYDRETLAEVDRHIKIVGKKNANYLLWSDYVYTRQMHSGIAMPKANAELAKKVLKAMDASWSKGLTHGEKAFYALTLDRGGYHKTAARIVESLRQFAIVKPHLGTYWDNINRGWRYSDKVAVTARILQAFDQIDPREDEINGIRKWMLLMKQTNDWGSSSLAADAVFTLLTTGSPWLERAPQSPRVTVAGQPVAFNKVDEWLGYARKTIDATSTGSVVIDRTASGPAWGAIYAQWVAPMTQVKAAAIEDLSITKRLALYNADGSLSAADVSELHVGDKVQVRLTIKNQRDLDYVTVIDERGACFEPVDQTSGHRYADRIGYYHETKDSSTRLFFNSLDKGTHVITYDLYVMAAGEFSVGIATVQSQYAPQETAHTAGLTVTVK